jgi:hypothetical protein
MNNMKKLVSESLNESMGYTDFFGNKVTHETSLQKKIRNLVTDVIMEERGISEKAFSSVDDVIREVKEVCDSNPKIYEKSEEFYKSGKRLQFLAEEIYEEYFKKKNENS